MVEQNESILKNLKDIQSLRSLLKSEMSIIDSPEGGIIANILVYNDAPACPDGGDVVFLGVGLRIIVGSERVRQGGSAYWPSRITQTRLSDRSELRRKYQEGTWVGGRSDSQSPPDVTSDEQSHGEVLFPGESVVYKIKTSKADLPYLDIRVEGSLSRRHLFHISQPIEELKEWTQPVIVQTFRALDAIDFYTPLLSLINVIPALGPQTTIAEISKFRDEVGKAREHLKKSATELKSVNRSAPNRELSYYIEKGILPFLGSAIQLCDKTIETLSGSDTEKMQGAAEAMKVHLLKTNEVKRGQKELKAQFGIGS